MAETDDPKVPVTPPVTTEVPKVPTEEPKVPSVPPVNPSVPVNPINKPKIPNLMVPNEPKPKPKNDSNLPQTGEQDSRYLGMLGTGLLIIGSYVFYKRKKTNKSSN